MTPDPTPPAWWRTKECGHEVYGYDKDGQRQCCEVLEPSQDLVFHPDCPSTIPDWDTMNAEREEAATREAALRSLYADTAKERNAMATRLARLESWIAEMADWAQVVVDQHDTKQIALSSGVPDDGPCTETNCFAPPMRKLLAALPTLLP